jgi:hypothetical protein
MEDVKPWYTSKTVIAGIIGTVLTMAQLLHIDQLAGIDKDTVADQVVHVTEGVLYVIALYGRIMATHAITK